MKTSKLNPKKLSVIAALAALAPFLPASLEFSLAQAAGNQPGGEGAKGMFFQQLKAPAEAINNGVMYWIELKRAGQTTRVSNRCQFRNGDQIRFHVRPNIDGYSYVLLREGSRGEHSVLFPDPRRADDNRVRANSEYSIPASDYLFFDNNPGTEKVLLLVSRSPLQAENFLKDSFQDKVVVASRIDGSKDLVPGSFVVSSAPAGSGSSSSSPGSTGTAVSPVSPAASTVLSAGDEGSDSSIITVVQRNPQAVLAVDICLEHGAQR